MLVLWFYKCKYNKFFETAAVKMKILLKKSAFQLDSAVIRRLYDGFAAKSRPLFARQRRKHKLYQPFRIPPFCTFLLFRNLYRTGMGVGAMPPAVCLSGSGLRSVGFTGLLLSVTPACRIGLIRFQHAVCRRGRTVSNPQG